MGALVSQLWETVETQAIYITELKSSIDEQEKAIQEQSAQIAELAAAIQELKPQSRSPLESWGPLGLLFGGLLLGLVVVRHNGLGRRWP